MTAITSVNPDLFAKIRDSAQMQMLHLSRQAEVLPYFRELDGPARPVVRMEGAERIMLGSNNYLGLTEDRRVLAAAHDALDRYGSGLLAPAFSTARFDCIASSRRSSLAGSAPRTRSYLPRGTTRTLER